MCGGKIAPRLADAGLAVLVPDMRGYGDSDKPPGTDGYDARSLAEEFRALVEVLEFGHRRPLTLVAFDMGAPPALLWAADHPDEVSTLLYLEEPVLLQEVISRIIRFERQAMERGLAVVVDPAARARGAGAADRRQRARLPDLV